jgi:hypothetical protein
MNTQEQIRSVLRGQKVVIVGGDPREAALSRLSMSFELSSLIHCPTRKSDASPKRFASRFYEPGIALVIWALGLSRTQHGEHLHQLCRQLDIPWVDSFRIPHPNSLAARIEKLHLLDALRRRRAKLETHWTSAVTQIGGVA